MNLRKRVFVSSVVEGFREYRETAREAITMAGGEPILVNEDFSALAKSPRNVCLEAVESCDIYIAIIGQRGGWTAPSGKLVVEEEYDRARIKKLPILFFLQKVSRDQEAQSFIARASDYVNGLFRCEFTNPAELREEVERALKPLLKSDKKISMIENSKLLKIDNLHEVHDEAVMRISLRPEREEEVISPTQLVDRDFIGMIMEIGHSKNVGLFDYDRAKQPQTQEDALVIHQANDSNWSEPVKDIRLELHECGQLMIDMNVTGRIKRGNSISSINMFVIAEEDIEDGLKKCFAFCWKFFERIDQFSRHNQFCFNVLFSSINYRTLERNPTDRNSFSVGLERKKEIVIYQEPRLIARGDFQQPTEEIKRILVVLARKLNKDGLI